jgi:hypothetical protein
LTERNHKEPQLTHPTIFWTGMSAQIDGGDEEKNGRIYNSSSGSEIETVGGCMEANHFSVWSTKSATYHYYGSWSSAAATKQSKCIRNTLLVDPKPLVGLVSLAAPSSKRHP